VVISGGRYDGLMKEMGSDAAASGFAIYIDNMLEAVTETFEEQRERKILVIFSESRFIEALKYSEGRRKTGAAVNMVNSGDISDPEQYRRQYDCSEVVIFE
jgi:ATP phosphoribosyltransferase regulatory subunit